MKRNKKLLILVLILVVAGGICGLVKTLVPDDSETKKANVSFADLTQEDITALEWTDSDETNKFIKNNDGWTLEEDEAFPANTVILDSMLNSVSSAKSTRALTDVNASDYGIDSSSDTVTVYKKDGSQIKMSFGDVNDVTDEYYMQVEGDNNVYMIATSVKEAFDRTRDDLIKMESIPNMSDAEKIVITKDGETLELARTENGESEEKITEWKSGETVLNTEKTDSLKNELIGIIWDECIDYNASANELNKFGLDEPKAKLIVDTPDDDVEIQFGNTEGESVYARLANSNMVYTVDKAILESMVTDTSTLVD